VRVVPTYRVSYEGPQDLAMTVATALADADGVNLTSSGRPERADGRVTLELVVDGDADDILDAVGVIRGTLPNGARLDLRSA